MCGRTEVGAIMRKTRQQQMLDLENEYATEVLSSERKLAEIKRKKDKVVRERCAEVAGFAEMSGILILDDSLILGALLGLRKTVDLANDNPSAAAQVAEWVTAGQPHFPPPRKRRKRGNASTATDCPSVATEASSFGTPEAPNDGADHLAEPVTVGVDETPTLAVTVANNDAPAPEAIALSSSAIASTDDKQVTETMVAATAPPTTSTPEAPQPTPADAIATLPEPQSLPFAATPDAEAPAPVNTSPMNDAPSRDAADLGPARAIAMVPDQTTGPSGAPSDSGTPTPEDTSPTDKGPPAHVTDTTTSQDTSPVDVQANAARSTDDGGKPIAPVKRSVLGQAIRSPAAPSLAQTRARQSPPTTKSPESPQSDVLADRPVAYG